MSRYILKDLVDFKNGYAFKSKFFSNTDGIPLIRIRDIKNSTTKTYYFGEYDNDFIVKNGDFLIGMDGNFEIAQWKGKDSLLNQRVCTFKIKDNNLNEKYLYYFLKIKLKQIEDVTGYTTVKHLSINTLKNIVIEIPSLQEQEKIVERFDKVFSNIDNIISNNSKTLIDPFKFLRSFFISKNKDIDFEIKSLSEISENLDRVRKPIKKGLREKGNIPYYGATGLIDYVKDFLFDEKLLLISEDGANLLDRNYPIAFSIEGRSWVNNHAHVLRFKNIEIQIYVMFYFNFSDISNFVSGAAQPKLNQQKLNSIEIPVPKNDEDLKYFVQKFQQIHLICSNYNQNINERNELHSNLKKSELNKEFSYE